MKVTASFFRWAIILFSATSILAVVAYQFISVHIAPLVVIRHFEKGETKMHYHRAPTDNISRRISVVVTISEDQQFLLHHGSDYNVIEKAAAYSIKSEMRKKRGVSTITQRTAKSVFLWPGRPWVRKGSEVYFTALIELIWSKQCTMEIYLNSIEMGGMIYGVDAIARYHFGKATNELSRSECALVAITLPSPIQFSSKALSGHVRLRQRKIRHEMKFIPSFPKKGEDANPNTTKGSTYYKKRRKAYCYN